MNTKSTSASAAAVTGARHLRMVRNGQDAATCWTAPTAGAIVVSDGCGSGAASEVGARVVTQVAIAELASGLGAGLSPHDHQLWRRVRTALLDAFARLAGAMPRGALSDHLLCTVIAAAYADDQLAVWAIGDGAYAIGDTVTVLGPFDGNAPPYLAYELAGSQQVHEHWVTSSGRAGSVTLATDGVAEVGLDRVLVERERLLGHPDALRRKLALWARADEHVDWTAQRVVRRPATLQDDGAVAILRWS